MMDQPSLAVVIAAHNNEGTLAQTLDSVVSRSLFGVAEIVVVDDGSTDGTASVARAFGDKVKVLSQANAGPGAARNLGVGASDSEWVAFLDADDLWFPWTLECIFRAIAEHPTAVFGLLQPFEFRDEEVPVGEALAARGDMLSVRYDPAIGPFANNREMPFLGSGALVIRRGMFVRLGGFTRVCRFGEDLDLILRAAAEGPLWIVEQPYGFAYRRHAGSLVSDRLASLEGMRFLFHQRATGAYDRSGDRDLVNAAIGNFARPVAVALARCGQLRNCLSLYWRLLGISMQQNKFKFLLGLPALMLTGKLRSLFGLRNG